MNVTIADAIGDSKRQFTNCYPSPTMPVMTNPSTSIAILRRLVLEAGGPAEFSRAYSRDDADKPIDPTYVSQILNGHRAFGEKARKNMVKRAGLADDFFEAGGRTTEPAAATYDFESPIIREAVAILKSLPRERQIEALGAIKIIAAQAARRQVIPHRARDIWDMPNVILLSEWKRRSIEGFEKTEQS